MADQVGRLQQLLEEIAGPDQTIPLVFLDWTTVADNETGKPVRAKVNVPIMKSAGAAIGQKGFFEVICEDMVGAIFALNPLDTETRHLGSYPMETFHSDGTYTSVDLSDPDQYAEVKAFLEQMVVSE